MAANLDASQRAFALLESRRQQEAQRQAQNFADSPTLKAALDTYRPRRSEARERRHFCLVATVQREVEKLSSRVSATPWSSRAGSATPPRSARYSQEDAGRDSDVWDVLASGGAAAAWPRGTPASRRRRRCGRQRRRDAHRHVRVVSAMVDPGVSIGRLLLATSLDDRYARDLSALSRAQTAVIVNGRVIASTLDPERKAALVALGTVLREGVVSSARPHAVRQLFRSGPARFYAVDSISAAAAQVTTAASEAILVIAPARSGWRGRQPSARRRAADRPAVAAARRMTSARARTGCRRGRVRSWMR